LDVGDFEFHSPRLCIEIAVVFEIQCSVRSGSNAILNRPKQPAIEILAQDLELLMIPRTRVPSLDFSNFNRRVIELCSKRMGDLYGKALKLSSINFEIENKCRSQML